MAIKDTAVGAAVYAATPNQNTRIAMILGALLEGGSLNGPWAVGDNGTSFGPWQIHLPAHPGVSAAQASDPNWAAKYMAPTYEKFTFAGPLGQTSAGAAQTVFKAERPAAMYPGGRINNAWATMHGQVTGSAKGGQAVADNPTDGGALNPLTGIGNSLKSIGTGVSDLEKAGKFLSSAHTWIRVGEFVIGAVLIVGGINIIAKPVTKPIVENAVKAAAVIPK